MNLSKTNLHSQEIYHVIKVMIHDFIVIVEKGYP